MPCRGIRGAITVAVNDAGTMIAATRLLLERIVVANNIIVEDIASAIFTTTPDLDAVCPAVAARNLGWVYTPLLCMQEMVVSGSLPRCIRVLIHWNTAHTPEQIQHIYLGEAQQLRPDLVKDE